MAECVSEVVSVEVALGSAGIDEVSEESALPEIVLVFELCWCLSAVAADDLTMTCCAISCASECNDSEAAIVKDGSDVAECP